MSIESTSIATVSISFTHTMEGKDVLRESVLEL